jgi:DNA modification methylase
MNRLYFGDNLKWLSDWKEFPDASVDLVYLDPPFNSNADYNVLFREPSGQVGTIPRLTPRRLRKELPSAWEIIRSKERCFRREIREASNFFRKLFPFLPHSERPASEERNGTWVPPVQRMLDQMDHQTAKGGT